MGRQFNLVAAGIALSILAADLSFAQGPPFPQGAAGQKPFAQSLPSQNHQVRRPANVPERWMQLPPEERQIFERNAERWLRMTPQQQNLLRQREKMLRARLKTEADTILRQSGLQLDQRRRDLFEARYMQERQKMERQLRQEFEAKRRQELPTLRERLKNEFQSPSPAQRPTSTPAVSTAPRR